MEPITSKNVDEKIKEVFASQYVSYWLKIALRQSLERDIVDAANDVELLAVLLNAKAKKVSGR